MLRLLRLIFLALLALFSLLIGMDLHVRNAHKVVVNYFGGNMEMSVSVLIALTLITGACLGILTTVITNRLNRRKRHPALLLTPVPEPAKAAAQSAVPTKTRKHGR